MLGNRTSTDAFDFNGFIDDVRIYSRALSAGDITQLYNLGYTPTVTTGAASAVTQTTATLNGNITQDNNTASSTKRGFAYSTDSALITGVSTTTESGTFGISAFTANISSLSAATTYYARAYASTATSTGFGSIQPFTTSSSVSAPSFNNFIVKLGNLFQVKLGSVFMLK
jgi:hypothetical protein